jgi:hypothetical protein
MHHLSHYLDGMHFIFGTAVHVVFFGVGPMASIHRSAPIAFRSRLRAFRRIPLVAACGRDYRCPCHKEIAMENLQDKSRHHRSAFAPVALITVGVVFLLQKNGIVDRQLIAQWWPLVPIIIGGWLLAKRSSRRYD